jgi:predicted glycosyl hydrolase (DUF1957 family)
MLWINFLHFYQPANSDAYRIEEALNSSYDRILRALEKNPDVKFTFNISACLVLRLVELKKISFINRVNSLIEKGQVEISSSAAYHALLPLVSEKEVIYQIRENERVLRKYFPRAKLSGFFLPEMAYGLKVADIIKKLSYSWIILDQISCQEKKDLDFSKVYKDKRSNLKVVFRSRGISNSYPPSKILNILSEDRINDDIIITATDAELYGLRHLDQSASLEKLLKSGKTKTILVSDYVDRFKKAEKISLRKSNWESSEKKLLERKPYHLWYDRDNKVHIRLWKLAKMVSALAEKYGDDPNYKWARWHLNRGLASCTFWWASSHNFKESFGPCAWNPDEVERGANELIRAMRSLEHSSSYSEKIKAESLFVSIKKIVWKEHWSFHANNNGI